MPTKKYRPYTPSRRFMTTSDFAEVTTATPEKSLLEPQRRTGGPETTGAASPHGFGAAVTNAVTA